MFAVEAAFEAPATTALEQLPSVSDCEVRDPSSRAATSAQGEYINGPRRPIDKRIDERRDLPDRPIAEVILDYSWVRVEDRT
jgi:hypothetical protein